MIRVLFALNLRKILQEWMRSLLLLMVIALSTAIIASTIASGRLSMESLNRLSNLEESQPSIQLTSKNGEFSETIMNPLLAVLPPSVQIHRESGTTPNLLSAISIRPPDSIDAEALTESLRLRLAYLSDPISITSSGSLKKEVETLTRSFRENISMLVLLSSALSLFILFAGGSLSAAQREFDGSILNFLGAPRKLVFWMIMVEAICFGAIGSGLGVLLGFPLTEALSAAFLTGITQHYALTPSPVVITSTISEQVFAFSSSFLVTIIAYLPSAYSLTSTSRKRMDHSYLRGMLWGMGGAGLVLLLLSHHTPLIGSVGVFCIACGLAPALLIGMLRWISTFSSQRISLLLARNALLRSGLPELISLSASVMAITLLVGMSSFVFSFKSTLTTWSNTVLNAEIFLRSTDSSHVPPSIFYEISKKFPSVVSSPIVLGTEWVGEQLVLLAGTDVATTFPRGVYPLLAGDPSIEEMQSGDSVVLSEPASRRLKKSVGDTIRIKDSSFRVAGIYQDFARDQGVIVFDRKILQNRTGLSGISSASFYVGEHLQELTEFLRARGFKVQTKSELKAEVDRIFDDTFAITRLLQLFLILMCALGTLLNFLQQLWEERATYSTLSILGTPPLTIAACFATQGFLLSMVAASLGAVAGASLGWYLCAIVNPAAFGWSIRFTLNATALLSAPLLLAGILALTGVAAAVVSYRRQEVRLYEN